MIEDDLNKIDFLFKTINFNEPFIPLKELKTKERRRCKEKRGEIQHGVWKGRDGAEE